MPSSRSRRAELERLGAAPFAHRGLHGGGRIENSASAIAAAAEAGFGVELDVQLSGDGEAMVFHDYELDRLTLAEGPVAGRSAAELQRLRFRIGGDSMPRLAEILDLLGGRVPLLVEVKSPGRRVERLCAAVARALDGYEGPVGVMSFNPEVARWFARHRPRVLRGLVVTEQGRRGLKGRIERPLALRRSRADFLACDVRDLPSRFAAAARRRGLPVYTWTVRSDSDRQRAAAHADQIIFETAAGVGEVVARIGRGVALFDPADWDRCAGTADPFLSHAFLSALEESGSATPGTGWQSVPIAIDGADGRPEAVMPAYVKSHSQGEYVFDHSWAAAWERAGGDYYPKLQIAVPFTPVPGRRLLAGREELALGLIAAAEAVVRRHDLSSAHATFIAESEVKLFERSGWLIRIDSQFHWHNRGYAGFEDFLAALSSRKRKAIRRERAAALEGLEVEHLTGDSIGEAHWDAFWDFYQDTGARKWGRPYLTRRFFSLLGERLADRLLLIFALRNGRRIAGALNLIGSEALYGRYWGAIEEVPHLHFEICYYQAIEAAIARGLERVEAGAQGPHKLSRGYEPVPTRSAHFIPDPNFRRAVADFLAAERRAVADEIGALAEMTPFRKE